MKKVLFVFLVLGVIVSLGACGKKRDDEVTEGTSMNDTFFNPLRIEQGLGDPWMYAHEGYYYYMHSEGVRISMTKSPSMTQITQKVGDESVTKVLLRQKEINVVEIWAPEIFFFEGHFYVYFTATEDAVTPIEKDQGRRTYGMKSVTDDPMGEWETPVEILLPADIRSIDATFMDYDGKQYVIWAGWPNETTVTFEQRLYITELEAGNPLKAKSTNPNQRIEISKPLYDWERSSVWQNEGPTAFFGPDGTPFLLYSGNFSGDDSYTVAWLKLTGDPMDPNGWYKHDRPLMQTDMEYAEVIAPGHASVVKSPDGKEDWICYHSAKISGSGWDRMTRLEKLEWDDEGNPYIDRITRFSDPVKLPGGSQVERIRYEAEDAFLSENAVIISLTGIDQNDQVFDYASNGKAVQVIDEEDPILFVFDVPRNGEYVLSVRFSNVSESTRSLRVEVNGVLHEFFAPRTQYLDSFITSSRYVELYIIPDAHNTVNVFSEQNILIDCIVVDYLNK